MKDADYHELIVCLFISIGAASGAEFYAFFDEAVIKQAREPLKLNLQG